MRTDIDIAALRRALENRRHELLDLLREETARGRGEGGLSQGQAGRLSRLSVLQGQEMDKARKGMHEAELRRIEAALKRMEDGEYGYCVSCGEEIGIARLEADPAVPTCIDCATRRK